MYKLEDAIMSLSEGKFVLVHDDKGREDEVDMVIAAESVRPKHIGTMRKDAGGLICTAISHDSALKLGLMYMHDILKHVSVKAPVLSNLLAGKSPYGDLPAFSISVNHRETYTGITDYDRALTINKIAEVCKAINSEGPGVFANSFRAPGHVPILISSKGLLNDRMGHTELCMYLSQIAGLIPSIVMCEMLDSNTHRAMSIEQAEAYAEKNKVAILEASQLIAYAKAV